MKFFKNQATEEVFGFDENDPTQFPYMKEKIDAGCIDITGSWPLPQNVDEKPFDPITKLKEFLSNNPDVLSQINVKNG